MEARKPFQGLSNIVRFNWPFYAGAFLTIISLWILGSFLPSPYTILFRWSIALIVLTLLISLAVSYYVYDHSSLYALYWLNGLKLTKGSTIININAGFDETSTILQAKFPEAKLLVYDFYNAAQHTEPSIRRARERYPSYPGTTQISTAQLPVADESADAILLILAAHEIRNDRERMVFFKELARALKPNGSIIVTEHLRDLPNFLAYTIGFFHFLPRSTWYHTFDGAALTVEQEVRTTPFITSFILRKLGTAS